MTKKQAKARFRQLRLVSGAKLWPSAEQRADWAYGNARIENPKVTRAMAERAVRDKPMPKK